MKILFRKGGVCAGLSHPVLVWLELKGSIVGILQEQNEGDQSLGIKIPPGLSKPTQGTVRPQWQGGK